MLPLEFWADTHTPYLEKLIEIRGNDLFEPKGDQSPSGDSNSGNTNLQSGGESGIRTHGALAGTTVFKTAAFDHSAISPSSRRRELRTFRFAIAKLHLLRPLLLSNFHLLG